MLCRVPMVPKHVYDAYLKVREANIYGDDTVMESVTQNDAVKALMVNSFYDITLKNSSFSVKRLKKHFKEIYNVDIPLKIIEEVFKDCDMLCKRVAQEQTIQNLKIG